MSVLDADQGARSPEGQEMIAARLVASIFWSLALLFWLILGLVYGVAWCIKEVARLARGNQTGPP